MHSTKHSIGTLQSGRFRWNITGRHELESCHQMIIVGGFHRWQKCLRDWGLKLGFDSGKDQPHYIIHCYIIGATKISQVVGNSLSKYRYELLDSTVVAFIPQLPPANIGWLNEYRLLSTNGSIPGEMRSPRLCLETGRGDWKLPPRWWVVIRRGTVQYGRRG